MNQEDYNRIKEVILYSEPWFDINEYETKHKTALEKELKNELNKNHFLYNKTFKVLAKREDMDEILIFCENCYIIVKLTWSSKVETLPYPRYEKFINIDEIKEQLFLDSKDYL